MSATPPISAVTNLAVATDGLNPPTMSWTPPKLTSHQKITGYNVILRAYAVYGVTTYAFDRSSTASSFQPS